MIKNELIIYSELFLLRTFLKKYDFPKLSALNKIMFCWIWDKLSWKKGVWNSWIHKLKMAFNFRIFISFVFH